jgi:hypothetical protein
MTNGPLHAALLWLQSAMLGTIATSVATLSVAAVGFLLLQGRVDMRRSVSAICGCFILFGAPVIARSFVQLQADGAAEPSVEAPIPQHIAGSPALPRNSDPDNTYDPYAGAAIPTQ